VLRARVILLTGFVVLMFNSGVRFSVGLVLKPMADDLDWTRSAIAGAVTIFMLLSALALPVIGRLVDRFGPNLVMSASVVLMGVGTAAMSWVSTPWHAVLCYGVVAALGSAGTSITPIGVLVSRWYPERIGLANSIAISGMGVGQLVIILSLAYYLDALTWRGAFVALGIANILCVLPFIALSAWFTRRTAVASAPQSSASKPPTSIRAAMATPYYRWLLAMYALCGFHDFFVATHVVAAVLDRGVNQMIAGNTLALMGAAGLLGVLVTGLVTDRRGPMVPTVVCFVLRIVIFGGLLLSDDPNLTITLALLFGATFWVTAPLTVVFVERRFGTASLGALAGTVTLAHHACGGLGALVGGALYDYFGNYGGAYWLALLFSVAAIYCAVKLVPKTKGAGFSV
jgi:MFS family permease